MATEKKASMAAFKKGVKEITGALLNETRKEMNTRNWTLAYLDARGDTPVMKFRIQMPNGRVVKTAYPPGGVTLPILDIWEIRVQLFSDRKLWGLKVSVYSNGKSDTELNHDPSCLDDPSFTD